MSHENPNASKIEGKDRLEKHADDDQSDFWKRGYAAARGFSERGYAAARQELENLNSQEEELDHDRDKNKREGSRAGADPPEGSGGCQAAESRDDPPGGSGGYQATDTCSSDDWSSSSEQDDPPTTGSNVSVVANLPTPEKALSMHSQSTSPEGTDIERAMQQLSSQYSPERMQITPQERKHALLIKQAIESIPDLENLSDMAYCQLAILGEGKIVRAVNRAYQLQEYKKEWGILDTAEDAVRLIPVMVKDRFVLSVDLNLQSGGYNIAYHTPKYDFTIFKSAERTRGVMQVGYYLPHLMSPDFASVRAGITSLFECQGHQFEFSKSFELSSVKMMAKGGWSVYPMKHRSLKFFNSSTVFNVVFSFLQSAMPYEIGSKFQFGCKFPAGSLDRMYNIPSEEVAMARLCQKLEQLIRTRYENERTFSLDDVVSDGSSDSESTV